MTLVDGLDQRLREDGGGTQGGGGVVRCQYPEGAVSRVEGKKTMGYELVEQCGWTYPDAVFYPTGGGVGLIGMWKAFQEMEAAGLGDRASGQR